MDVRTVVTRPLRYLSSRLSYTVVCCRGTRVVLCRGIFCLTYVPFAVAERYRLLPFVSSDLTPDGILPDRSAFRTGLP